MQGFAKAVGMLKIQILELHNKAGKAKGDRLHRTSACIAGVRIATQLDVAVLLMTDGHVWLSGVLHFGHAKRFPIN